MNTFLKILWFYLCTPEGRQALLEMEEEYKRQYNEFVEKKTESERLGKVSDQGRCDSKRRQ